MKIFIVEGVSDDPIATVAEAQRYWGQLCVDLQPVEPVETIPDPTGQLRKVLRASGRAYFYDSATNTEVDCANEAYLPGATNPLPRPAVCALTPTQRPLPRFAREAPSSEMMT
jgi:hypothetical protein